MEAVLDMQAELQRLGSLHLANADEVRRLMQEVLNRVSQAGMQKGEVKPHHSFSIRSEDERIAVKQLLARFRQLPAQQQNKFPPCSTAWANCNSAAGTLTEPGKLSWRWPRRFMMSLPRPKLSSMPIVLPWKRKSGTTPWLQSRKRPRWIRSGSLRFPCNGIKQKEFWEQADSARPFCAMTAILTKKSWSRPCMMRAMERNMADVFREARLLRSLNHPAIIGVHECEFADSINASRPYIVRWTPFFGQKIALP